MCEVEMIVDDLIVRLREYGYDAEVTYTLTRTGDLVEFKIRIIGRLD